MLTLFRLNYYLKVLEIFIKIITRKILINNNYCYRTTRIQDTNTVRIINVVKYY